MEVTSADFSHTLCQLLCNLKCGKKHRQAKTKQQRACAENRREPESVEENASGSVPWKVICSLSGGWRLGLGAWGLGVGMGIAIGVGVGVGVLAMKVDSWAPA